MMTKVFRPLFTALLALPVLLDAQPNHGAHPWTASVSANNYIFADDYIFSPVVSADHDWLHLEGRYNYEDLQTLSVFGGYNVHAGGQLLLDVTPMIGFAVGNTTAIIPAAELTLSYGRFELYTESEFLVDFNDAAFNFFYAWTELNYSPLDWLSLGLVATRTRLFDTDLAIQRGLSAGFYAGAFSLYGSLMNLGSGDPYVFLSAGWTLE